MNTICRRLFGRHAAAIAAITLAAVTGISAAAVAQPPPAPDFGAAGIESLAKYEGQSTCDPVEKPGVAAFRSLIQRTYSGVRNGGTVRNCVVGGKSEHKEGRAWDWMLGASSVADRTKAEEVLSWLLSTDCHGNKFAMARRLGIQYVIWDRSTWKSYRDSSGWTAYTGANPHTDHIHFSFTWAGANKQTSYWRSPSTGTTCLRPGTAPSPHRQYVEALYTDFLGRSVDPAGLDHWTRVLSTGQLSGQQVAYSMATTDEYLNHVVTGFYATTLGRQPDAPGLRNWRTQLRAGMPVAEVASRFYGSAEYIARAGGTPEAWVTDLYKELLGRQPDAPGLRSWVARYRTVGSAAVAAGFYQSPESLKRRVSQLYSSLLGRGPDAAGLKTWPPVVRDKGDLALASFIASSAEYKQKAKVRFR